MIKMINKTLAPENLTEPAFWQEVALLTEDVADVIDERLIYILENFNLPDDDVIIDTDVKSAMLWKFAQFITNNHHLPASAVRDIRHVTSRDATKFFSLPQMGQSHTGDSALDNALKANDDLVDRHLQHIQKIAQLETKVASLEAQVEFLTTANTALTQPTLHAENSLIQANYGILEAQTISALRRKPSKRNKPIFSHLEEYIRDIASEEIKAAGIAYV